MAEKSTIVTALIPLPVTYNPDEQGNRDPVEDEKFVSTADEIATEFQEGGTLHIHRDGRVSGFWWDKGVVDHDVHAVLEVDIPDTEEARGRLRAYAKAVLLARFRQKAIYIKFVRPVERLIVTDDKVAEC